MKRKIISDCFDIALSKIKTHPQYAHYIHYSFVIQNNKIVGFGVNRSAEPTIGYPSYGKLHSEVDVWHQCKGILGKDEDWSIVNIRMDRKGALKISKPCKCCFEFLRRLGCKEVWFSTAEGFALLRF